MACWKTKGGSCKLLRISNSYNEYPPVIPTNLLNVDP